MLACATQPPRQFARVLVDEFQDTDPIQAEIVFPADREGEPARHWHEQCRFGRVGLFMVGDPKQAIYRFRGADIATYRLAREAIERQFPGNVLRVASNFRSCDDILQHINRCFETPLQSQETGYVALEATRQTAEHGLPCVAKVKVDVVPDSRVDDIRDEEARIVAETCARLIGNVRVRRADRETHVLSAGDIALLAPTGTELWRYERALEEAELPFSSQAGKNFFRRQEVQDLVALVRALADPRDTIALGALLRGPLVGLTEQELLDLAEALASQSNGAVPPPRLSLRTDPASIPHPLVRETLAILRDLRLRVRSTAPALLLAEAVERLNVRAILVTRSPDQASRALANVDAMLEKARAYGVRGFRQFARDLDDDWSRRLSHDEGVVDADEHSIKIVTIHSSKGLEWPVVIPINTASGARPLGAIRASAKRRYFALGARRCRAAGLGRRDRHRNQAGIGGAPAPTLCGVHAGDGPARPAGILVERPAILGARRRFQAQSATRTEHRAFREERVQKPADAAEHAKPRAIRRRTNPKSSAPSRAYGGFAQATETPTWFPSKHRRSPRGSNRRSRSCARRRRDARHDPS